MKFLKNNMQGSNLPGIGIDIEEVKRFRKINFKKNQKFLDKIYTKNELSYCLSKKFPAQHLAARFSAKEAVLKAAGGRLKVESLNEIEVVREKTGGPQIKLNNTKNGNLNIFVSLSHSSKMAVAIAVIFPKNGSKKI